MKKSLFSSKSLQRSILFVAIVAAFTTSAMAQLTWSGTQNLTNGQVITQNITLTGSVSINVASGTATISGVIGGGAFNITKTGAGTLILSGSNVYVGTTTVSAGTLEISTNANLGTSSLAVSIASGATLRFENQNSPETFSRVISGEGNFVKSGIRNLTLRGTNTYSGTTTVNEGILNIASSANLGSANSAVTVASAAYLQFDPATTMTFSRVITGGGGAQKSGFGTLTLSGTNTYTGRTEIFDGTLQISSAANLSATSGVLLARSGATLRFNNPTAMSFDKVISGPGDIEKTGAENLTLSAISTYSGTTTISAGALIVTGNLSGIGGVSIASGATLILAPTTVMVFEKVISGAGSLQKIGTGVSVLTGINTYTGTTAVGGGILRITESANLGNATSAIWIDAGATLRFQPSADINFNRVIEGPGNVDKTGLGTLTLFGTHNYTGSTTISSGVLRITGNLAGTTGEVSILQDGTLRLESTLSTTFNRVISGAGNLEKGGLGTVHVAAENTYTGTTTINSGTLRINFPSNLGNATSAISVATGAMFEIYPLYDMFFSRVITGGGSFSKSGNYLLLLSGVNAYTGSTYVNDGGILQVGDGLFGTIQNSSGIHLSTSNAMLRFNQNFNTNLSAAISGSGNIEKLGTGTLTLSGNNTATGYFYHREGGVSLSGAWAGDYSINPEAALTVTGNVKIGGNLSMYGGTLNFNLSGSAPSKLSVTGAQTWSTIGPLLNITANNIVTNYVLIEAASVTSSVGYGVDLFGGVAGMNHALSTNATQLLLTINPFSGSGTSSDPYMITSAGQLAQLATFVNEGNTFYNNKYYKLGNDINLSDYGAGFNNGAGWVPIGICSNINNCFKGVFDGNNHKISGLYINRQGNDDLWAVGLFGAVRGGTVKNLGVEDININVNTRVGGIAGAVDSYGMVENCYTTGSITSGDANIGGIAGIVFEATLSNCYSTCDVSGNEETGGVVGNVEEGFILNCYATGHVSGNSYIGGVAGYVTDSEVSNCAALNPSVTGTNYAGRVVGTEWGTLSNNIAYAGLLNNAGNTTWSNIGATGTDGADMSKQTINTDGTLGNRFTAPVWTTENSKLPGLFGSAVAMPVHIFMPYFTGSGTNDDPYQITTPAQLAQLATFVNEGNVNYNDKHYKLMNNIGLSAYGATFNGGKGWIPIGTRSGNYRYPFKGNFDGNNKLIADLLIKDYYGNSPVGLFGYIDGATIKNLGLLMADVSGTGYVGTIAGVAENGSSISYCFANTGSIEGNNFIGGITGYANNSGINNCYSTVYVIGMDYVGGITGMVAYPQGIIDRCWSSGSVGGDNFVGNIAGQVAGGGATISNCVALSRQVAATVALGGRITGNTLEASLNNNYAFAGMLDHYNTTLWSNIGYNEIDGANISKIKINVDGTLGDNFLSANGWKVEEGKLPGLFGSAVNMPEHLQMWGSPFEGSGTENDPYLIYTPEELATLAAVVNEGITKYNAAYYKLMNNLDLSYYGANYNNGKGWIPIGIYKPQIVDMLFKGNFDGNEKVITGLYINDENLDFAGLFGAVEGTFVTIENLGVENVNINAGSRVGGIVGEIFSYSGSLSNCYTTGNLSGTSFIGGVGGFVRSSVTNCYSTVTVNGSGVTVGGVIGYLSNASISNCYSTGEVSGGNIVGGVVATAWYSSVTNCAALNPKVEATYQDVAGRVEGGLLFETVIYSNNIAFDGILNTYGNTYWENIGADQIDGADMTAKAINTDGTLGNRFGAPVWTTQKGKLPGLFGNAVEMPEHLLYQIEFCGGTGYPEDPYLICDAEQLNTVRFHLDKHFKLNNDIDLSEYSAGEGWLPIGENYVGLSFSGSFDGDGKVVRNLTINKPDENFIGLFGLANGATIINVGIENCNVTGKQYVGGLAGFTNDHASINKCYVTGSVTSTTQNAGGLVGGNFMYSTISNSYATANVSVNVMGAGGLVGANCAQITNCYATGDVSGNTDGAKDIGGLVGSNYQDAQIHECYATGTVAGSKYVGGLVGINAGNATIRNSVAANAAILASQGLDFNRITGENTATYGSTLTNNYAYEEMTINGATTTGTLDDENGSSVSLMTLMTINFYSNDANWYRAPWPIAEPNFIWDICENETLPFLIWQNIECEGEEEDVQIIPLISGSNWISINVLNDNPTILKQMQDVLEGTGDKMITSQNGGMSQYYADYGFWYSEPSTFKISEKEMYMFELTTNLDLNLVGELADPATTDIPLRKGQNWIGYIPNFSAPVGYALEGLDAVEGDLIMNQNGDMSEYYVVEGWGNFWFPEFDMHPGYGYVLSSEEAQQKSFYYPSESPGRSQVMRSGEEPPVPYYNFYYPDYPFWKAVRAVIMINGEESKNTMLEVGAICETDASVRGSKFLEPLGEPFWTITGGRYTAQTAIYGFTSGYQPIILKVYDHGAEREYNTIHESLVWTELPTSTGTPTAPFIVTIIPNYDIITTVSLASAGYITGNNATMIHDVNTSLTLTAIAEEGYEFVNWTEGTDTYTTNTLTFTVTENRNLVANFKSLLGGETFEIALSANPTDGGTVTGGGEYEEGETVTVTATPEECYEFIDWIDDDDPIFNTTDNPYSFTATENRNLTANFEIINTVPTFTGITLEYCSGASIPALPTTSGNGITGSWSPAINNTATTEYTFTPTAGQCATTATVTINIIPKATPIFTGITTTYNEGATIPALPTTSDNEITGAWTPAINNMATTTYTFTPAPTECANTATLTITIIPVVVVEYTITVTIEPEESGTVEGAGIYEAGEEVELTATAADCFEFVNWTEDSEEVSTDNPYIFDADDNRTLVANFVPIVITPTFTGIVTEYCEGASIPALPTTSSNSITGAWSPAIDNTTTKTYTFTPAVGQCATTATVTINITPKETPIFASVITTYTEGDDIPDLPLESDNGITGTWEPEINNMATTTYTFTPATTECAVGTTLTIVINPAPILVTQEIELGAGWNWISTNVLSTTPSILSQMKTSLNEVGIIIKGSGSYVQNEPPWMGSLKAISEKEMYQVQVTAGHTLTLTGTQADPATTPITVNNLWNWIGYVPAFATPVSAALTGLDPQDGDLIKGQTSFTQYYAIGSGIWMGSLKSLQSGAGYMYYSTNTAPKVFYYPSAPSKSPIIEYPSPYELKRTPKGNLYTGNMTITAIVVSNDKEVSSDALEIQAFCGSECRGSVLLSYEEVLDRYFGFLMVHGNGDEMITLKVYDHTTGKEYTAENAPFQFITNQIVGNITNPYIVDLGMIIGIDDITNEKVSIYPNPTKDQLFISHPWATLDVVEVADMYGRIILRQTNFSNSFISTKDIACGLYILKITNNNKTTILKFVKD